MTFRPAVSTPTHPFPTRQTRYGLLVLAAAVAGLVVLSWFARAEVMVRPGRTALAAVLSGIGNRVTSVQVRSDTGIVPTRILDGRIWPIRPVAPGAVLHVSVGTSAWGWNPWVGASSTTVRMVAPANPKLAASHTEAALGQKPLVRLTTPSVGLSFRLAQHPQWVSANGVSRTFTLTGLQSRPGIQDTLLIRTRARSWETWSKPALYTWTTPAFLSAGVGWTTRDGAPVLTIHFSEPVAHMAENSVRLAPSLAGAWHAQDSRTWVFQPDPADALYPGEAVTLRVAGGRGGIRATSGTYLAHPLVIRSSLPLGQVLRAQELLASLGYLPLQWTGPGSLTPTAELRAAYAPPTGTFSWRYSNTPSVLSALWSPGQLSPLTAGAVMTFESQHGLATDGLIGPQVWKALIQASEQGQHNTAGYSYVYVSETLPEELTLWQNGQVVLTSLVNTGIPATPTYLGTFPVYLRYTSQTMSGVNPNGTRYSDPGVPWVNYFQGADAVHGFVRSHYGYPQSLGCVELPVAEAAIAWKYIQYGTLVTVAPPGSPHSP